jgi:hypothetical protein
VRMERFQELKRPVTLSTRPDPLRGQASNACSVEGKEPYGAVDMAALVRSGGQRRNILCPASVGPTELPVQWALPPEITESVA